MENKVFVAAVLLISLFGTVLGDVCYDGDITLYCDYDCCGVYGDQYCCSYYWSTGGIAGITIGCIVFTVFWIVVILLCRRRRIYGTYWGRPAGTMTVVNQNHVATVSSTNTFAAQPPPYGQFNNQYGNQVRY